MTYLFFGYAAAAVLIGGYAAYLAVMLRRLGAERERFRGEAPGRRQR